MEEKNKKKNNAIKIIFVIILICIVGIICGIVYANFFSKTEIDLSKYVSIDFDGYSGYVSYEKKDLIIDTKRLKKILDSQKLANKLEKKLLNKAKLKNNTNVENGDEIKVTFKIADSWLKENKIKLKSNTIKIKVKNLEDSDSLNLFDDLEFTYSGISPNLTVYLDNNSEDDFLKHNVTYTMKKDGDDDEEEAYFGLSNIANGDKIIVTAEIDSNSYDSSSDKNKNTYSFVVKDQAEYIQDSKDISSEIKNEIEKELSKKAQNIANDANYDVTYTYPEDFLSATDISSRFTHSEPELVKMYLATNKDMTETDWLDNKNMVFAIYKSTFTDTTTSKNYDYFIAVCVDDLVISEKELSSEIDYYYDKYYSYNDADELHKSSDELYKLFEDEMKDKYTITEIK